MTENRLMVGANTKESIPDYLFTETGELNIGDALKILCVTADAAVKSVEAINNELRINVVTVFKVIYQTADGVSSYAAQVNSNRSVVSDGIAAGTQAVVWACVLDCEYAGATNIKVKATIQLSGWYLKQSSLNLLTENMPEIFCKTARIKAENVEILPTVRLNLTFNNEARMPISKILDCKATAFINNVYPENGSFQTEGEVLLRVVSLSDNGQFMCQTFVNTFNTETLAEEITSASTLDVMAFAESTDITLSAEDNRAFISDIRLSLNATSSVSQELESVVDAYSMTNRLVLNEHKYSLDSLFCLRSVRDKVSANVKIKTGINDVECAVGALVAGSSLNTNDALNAEGVITATVIYTGEDNKLNSVNVELPFYTQVAKEFDCDSALSVSVSILNVFARLRTTSEIEVTAEFIVTVKGKRTAEVNVISEIEIGEEKETDDVAISLYIVKPAQGLWEVAKELNTSETVLINQNPELKLPVKAGDKVILYKEINFEL